MNKQIFTFFFLLVSLFGLNQAAKAQCQYYAVSGPTSGADIEAGGTATAIALDDDELSGAISIGFSFLFYGNSYTQLYISSNGFISFDPAVGNSYNAQLIPDASSPNNLIAGFWQDLDPWYGGTITYQTKGSAPNRRMLVTFTNINHYGGSNPVTFQIKLYEATGIIEIHSLSCPSFGGNHTQGIENANGTIALTASGRNLATFSPSNDVVTFTPTTTTIANPGAQNLNVIANTCAANYTIADPITNTCIGATWGYSTTGATTLNSSGNIIADGTGSGVLSFNKGATVVTLTCSAATSTTFTVTVTDNQAPTLASPGAQNLNVIANTCAANYTIADPITDNCTGATWGYSTTGATTLSSSGNTIADGTGSGVLSFNKGATVVTLTGTDGTNAATSTTFTVTVTDNQVPTLASPGNQTLTTISNTCAATYTIADPITDNCTGATWGYSTTGATILSSSGNTIADGTGSVALSFNKGATVVTLTGTDGTNAATSTTFTVTVTDNQAPTLANPGNQSLNVINNTCAANYTIADPITDNCTGATWGYSTTGATTLSSSGNTIADGTGSGALSFNVGATVVTLTGTDGTNAATSTTFTVTVVDNQAPSITCPANITVSADAGQCTSTNVNLYSISAVPIVNPDFEIVYKSGSSSVTAPLLSAGQEISGNTNLGMAGPNVTFSDNTTGSSFDLAGWTFNTQMGISNRNGSFGTGRNNIVWMNGASYGGGTAEKTMSQTLSENLQQSVTYTLTADFGWRINNPIASGPPVLRLYAGATLLTPVTSVSPALVQGGFVTYTRTYSINNNAISGPLRIEFGLGANTNALQLNTDHITLSKSLASTSDNCSGVSISATLNGNPVTNSTQFSNGVNTVVWTATDASSNTATCSQTVTVTDNQAPTLANPGNQSLNVINNTCAADYTIADPITDNCTGATWGYSTTGATTLSSSGNTIADGTGSGVLSFNKGVTEVTLTGTDAVSNVATSTTFTVTVTDNQAPTLASPGNQTLTTISSTCASDYTIENPITDNCTGSFWGYSTTGATTLSSSGNTIADGTGSGVLSFNKGVTEVTLTGTDAVSNVATSTTFTVTVTDNQAPTLASPGNQTLTTISSTCASDYTIENPISDNCTGSFWGYSTTGATTLSSSGNTIADGTGSGVLSFNVGATAVTLTGIDAVSNIATSTTFTVTVTDNEAPVISCPQDVTVNANYAGCTYNGSIGLASVTDNCSATVSGPIPAGPYSVGTTTVVWTATDASGNTSTCSQIITVLASPTASSSSVSTLGCYVWNVNNTTYSVSGVYTASFINAMGCDSIVTLNLTITPGIFVAAKAILAGPYVTAAALMHDSLRVNGLIPTTEPYTASPYNKTAVGGASGETVSNAILNVSGNNAIVDWVFIELRDAASNGTVIANKRALIQRDGDIVSSIDGLSPVYFPTVYNGNYYVSIKHRNHLGVMSFNAISFSGCSTTSVDFTTSDSVYKTICGNPAQRKQSAQCMPCGRAMRTTIRM
ncbi:hyalin [Filimonas sp.]|nr:hyalin [Filimonas sp.]